MKHQTSLNCSIGIGSSRLMAKICSDQAKPNGILLVPTGQEQRFLARLDVGRIPGVGKVAKATLNQMGVYTIGDLQQMEEREMEKNFGKWGPALLGKARGEDAGAWFAGEVGEDWQAKSISHEHTYGHDTADREILESTLARLSEMVGRRLREQGFSARTMQLKLRYSDFTTITRAHSLAEPTNVDNEIFSTIRRLFHANWEKGRAVRLLGVHAANFDQPTQMDLLQDEKHQRWARALSASDQLRDKYGESAVFLGGGMRGGFRERVHENPAERPSKPQPQKPQDESPEPES
jgi:DNA polymerase-4